MSLPTPETEGRPSEPKDKRSATKGTLKDGGGSPGKSGNDITGKGYASARENASQRSALLAKFIITLDA